MADWIPLIKFTTMNIFQIIPLKMLSGLVTALSIKTSAYNADPEIIAASGFFLLQNPKAAYITANMVLISKIEFLTSAFLLVPYKISPDKNVAAAI